jgi:hypothetical protein
VLLIGQLFRIFYDFGGNEKYYMYFMKKSITVVEREAYEKITVFIVQFTQCQKSETKQTRVIPLTMKTQKKRKNKSKIKKIEIQ